MYISHNLLYAEADKETRRLVNVCKNCKTKRPADNNCVYQNLIGEKNTTYLKNPSQHTQKDQLMFAFFLR